MSGNPPENARFLVQEYRSEAVINSSRRQLSDAEAAKFTPQNILKGNDNWNPLARISNIISYADSYTYTCAYAHGRRTN